LQIISAEFRALTTLLQENIQFALINCLEFAPGKLILKKLKNLVLIHCLDDKLNSEIGSGYVLRRYFEFLKLAFELLRMGIKTFIAREESQPNRQAACE
jgi:hypothetical protein